MCVCVQTNIGSILAAVNPYKQIPGLYDSKAVQLYSKHQLGELPPHIYALANECYRCLWKRADSQCVLIRYCALHPTPYRVSLHPTVDMSNLIHKALVWVQVFNSIKHEPHLIPHV